MGSRLSRSVSSGEVGAYSAELDKHHCLCRAVPPPLRHPTISALAKIRGFWTRREIMADMRFTFRAPGSSRNHQLKLACCVAQTLPWPLRGAEVPGWGLGQLKEAVIYQMRRPRASRDSGPACAPWTDSTTKRCHCVSYRGGGWDPVSQERPFSVTIHTDCSVVPVWDCPSTTGMSVGNEAALVQLVLNRT